MVTYPSGTAVIQDLGLFISPISHPSQPARTLRPLPPSPQDVGINSLEWGRNNSRDQGLSHDVEAWTGQRRTV